MKKQPSHIPHQTAGAGQRLVVLVMIGAFIALLLAAGSGRFDTSINYAAERLKEWYEALTD